LTCNEIRHLIANLIITPGRDPTQIQACSDWRRSHQGKVRHAHYKRRLKIENGLVMLAAVAVHAAPRVWDGYPTAR
jgi:hypothetical protein